MPAQREELGVATGQLGGGEQAHQLDARDVVAGGARPVAHRRARLLHTGAFERDQVHRHLRPPGASRGADRAPARPASPPSRSRTAAAMRRASATSSDASSQFTATSGGRAPTATAPERGMRGGRADVGRAADERVAAGVRQRACLRVGVVVEEHRDGERLGDPRRRTPVPRPPLAAGGSAPRATNGTTSSAPSRGWTPAMRAQIDAATATAQRERARRVARRPGRPG